MGSLTASNLVRFIAQLDGSVNYNYVYSRTRTLVRIARIESTEGPIFIRRGENSKKISQEKEESISSEMLWRVANAISPNAPFNLDRILGASYNTRSALEALLAHTAEFYFCYPGRVESTGGQPKIKKGHKHLIWLPDRPHKVGAMEVAQTNVVISELQPHSIQYDVIPSAQNSESSLGEAHTRRHAQMQIALYFIGQQLGFRTWIAQNDHAISFQGKRLVEYEGVLPALSQARLIANHPEIIEAAKLIDCIWFKNGTLLPAVIEIEHSTGITSGLTRMKKLKELAPGFPTRYVIVAPDELRAKVVKESNQLAFRDLDARFFPYSAVEEMYSLFERRKPQGITQEFLDCFMEKVVS